MKARRAGRIDFDAIRDDGVTADVPSSFTGKAGFWRAVRYTADTYRRDRREGQPHAVEVWCEAAGMVPQLVRVAGPYGIPVYSSSGFDSLTAKHEAALRAGGEDRPLLVLHVGDLDPSGVHLFTAAAEDVGAWADHYGGATEFERVALTPEQVTAYGLPTAPPKRTDKRRFEGETTQAEALPPDVLAAIVDDAIRTRLDLATLARVEAVEATERAELLDALDESA